MKGPKIHPKNVKANKSREFTITRRFWLQPIQGIVYYWYQNEVYDTLLFFILLLYYYFYGLSIQSPLPSIFISQIYGIHRSGSTQFLEWKGDSSLLLNKLRSSTNKKTIGFSLLHTD